MPDKLITDLLAASALTGAEVLHVSQGGNSRKTTVQDITSHSPLITDLTVELPVGDYSYFESSAVGAPATSSFFNTLRVGRNGSPHTFLAQRVTANPLNFKMWFGARAAATGSILWSEVPIISNMIGTVSHNGSYATGAIFERGSNANGEYMRFADGTQICHSPIFTGDVNTAHGTLYRLASMGTWTLPAAFMNANFSVYGSNAAANVQTHWGNARPTATTTVEYTIMGVSSLTNRSCRFTAIGRWV